MGHLDVLFGKGHLTPHQSPFATVVESLALCPQYLFLRDRTSFPTLLYVENNYQP